MKAKIVFATTLVLSSLLFVGCKPKTVEPSVVSSPTPAAQPVKVQAEAAQVQKDICGKLTATAVSSAVGTKVMAPTVTTIDSTTGAKRHVCTYSKDGDPGTNVVYLNVTFKGENKSEMFQQLWENQKVAQKDPLEEVAQLGSQAFYGVVDKQPVLYVLTENGQYWLRLGMTTQNVNKQKEVLKKMAGSIVGK